MNNFRKTLLLITGLLFTLLAVSIIYSSFLKTDKEPQRFIYNDKGEIIERAPFPPSLSHPLGTDEVGNDLALRMVEGAKFTLVFITSVSLLRILISMMLAYLLVFPFRRISEWVETVFTPFRYIPGLILVLLLSPDLHPLSYQNSMWQLVLFQFILFVLIGIPILSTLLVKESRYILSNEYIIASRQLGASSWHIYTKQILPVLKNRLIVVFLQQLSINMLLLIQLGVFQYYIGGRKPGNIAGDGEVVPKFLSRSGEWAGMIGSGIDEFIRNPWIFFGPLFVTVSFLIIIKILANRVEDERNF
ncbi:hypothetical protein AM500_18565 [Bacillus sp. FJAT-18017]|nr:hypothetical protein AM500_18565 [Bacillus sp. FJAT-18017]